MQLLFRVCISIILVCFLTISKVFFPSSQIFIGEALQITQSKVLSTYTLKVCNAAVFNLWRIIIFDQVWIYSAPVFPSNSNSLPLAGKAIFFSSQHQSKVVRKPQASEGYYFSPFYMSAYI